VPAPVTCHLSEADAIAEDPPGWLDSLAPVSDLRITRFGEIWVWSAETEFEPWTGHRPDGLEHDCRKGDNLVLGNDQGMSCAEIETVRRLRERQWTAGWLATCGRRNDAWRELMLRVRTPRSTVLPTVRTIPSHVRAILEAGGRAGHPDVVAWRRSTGPVFVELKGPGDSGDTQVDWLTPVWRQGLIRHTDFLLLRWGFKRRGA